MTAPLVSLSPLDLDRFGVVTARCPKATASNFAEALQFCRVNEVELLLARCDAPDSRSVHVVEEAGGRLMDTLVYYSLSLATESSRPDSGAAAVRPLRQGDAASVRDVAAAAFAGYMGHYHNDSRLDRSKADETYPDWAHRSCTEKGLVDEVLIAERGGAIVGFLTLRLNHAEEAEIVLNGVTPAAQGAGVYRGLLQEAIHWSRNRATRQLIVSTQLANTRVQQAWVRTGFVPFRAFHTFHLWFR